MTNNIYNNIKTISLLLFAICLICCSSSKKSSRNSKPIEFSSLYKGYYCDNSIKKNAVIKSNKELKELWKQTFSNEFPVRDIPSINFNKEMIVAVFMGEFNSGGYSTTITKIEQENNQLIIYIKESEPGKNCGVTNALSQPFHIIKTSLTDLDISFNKVTKINNCD